MSQHSVNWSIKDEILSARWISITVIVFLAVHFLIIYTSSRHLTLTYDESKHYRYGVQILEGNSDRFDDSKMPFSALNALLGRLSVLFPADESNNPPTDVQVGRIATILFAVLVAILVFTWSRELYGSAPALFSLLLFAFEPNIIAHAQLVTTDIYATGMIALTIFTLWQFSQRRNWKSLILFSLAIALAQLAKYTAVFLFPLSAGLILIRDMPNIYRYVADRDGSGFWQYIRRMGLYAFTTILIVILVINLGFLFNRTLTPLGDYNFRSDLFRIVQAKLHNFGQLPVPLPYPFLEGLDLVRYYERTGQNMGKFYLLGKLSKTEGFTSYFTVASLVKVPIAIHLAFLAALFFYLSKWNTRRFLENELFLLGPMIFFSIYFTFFFQAQIGVRFFLVVFPFVHIFCASLLTGWSQASRRQWVIAAVLSVYLIASAMSYYPHFIPYFNELVPNRRQAYKILADSNLDWGHAGWYLRQYWAEHPEIVIDPDEPTAGRIVISVNSLVGITAEPETYRWLRKNFEPVDTVAYTYLVYEVSPEDLAKIHVAP